ncbi:hypothetical protein Ccar_10620 [Clostridium carboxidivorans P7]|uniref:Lipoprotein n=1 Tax=Clostridium carboxidivorans P7 TaxID=536227 RepID=C6PNW2_9CLOT|nr:hypothetical protein [Clostridium carboxidivorans]AKN31281.1 hypothetical protein Ccar_10620 [Clostridium carboxidivorans P7]EET89040.1 hypothetical protein CcarbDRAFT_0479 [Clostridium carboxidivorans P7]EFG88408.1 lipoprotein, putative [Clostridium carboxidivorans P7]
MKKFLSIIMTVFVLATFAGCKKQVKVANQEQSKQTQEDKSKDSTSENSKLPGKINGIDVDAMLKDTFPNDPDYAYKEKSTKDFITKGEDIKKMLGDKYKQTGDDQKNFTKQGKKAKLEYNFYRKNYKDNLNEYSFSLYFNDEKKCRVIDSRNEINESVSEQNVKLDDMTKNILKKFSNNIQYEEVEKKMNQCMALAKEKKNDFVDDLKVDDHSTITFMKYYDEKSQIVKITLHFQTEEYGYK